MKRVIDAIIAEIHEQMPPAILAAVLTQFVMDVLGADAPDDAEVCLGINLGDFKKVGAVWRHGEMWEIITSEVSAKFVHSQYGDVMMAAAGSGDELLHVIRDTKHIVTEAAVLAASMLDGRYTDVSYDADRANQVVLASRNTLDTLVNLARRALAGLNETDGEPTKSAEIYQFPGTTTVH